MIRRVALLAAAGLAVSLAACGGESERSISKVFTGPPWTEDENYTYQLTRVEDDEPYGECQLHTRLNQDGANTRLEFLCSDGENRDDGTALVDGETLVPLSSNRTQVRPEKNDRVSFDATYEPPIVKFASDENGKKRATQRDLPEPDDTNPEPGYYDDVSLLWLVRAITLEEGYEGAFQNVAPGTGQTFRVDLRVDRQETVTVPAGEFQVWRVRLRTASLTNLYWIEVAEPHRLIRARIPGVQDLYYELLPND